ncbi:hypothetical protein [Dialister succinatiphilus]|uniref:hypothetical protein n=1 Tax=Dialister succinatiphilus TaxID=487173 RepID=UPI0012EA14E7|nr:hypothetical protein [Dialister succinatiphilus]
MTYEKSSKELLCMLKAGAESFGPEIIELVKSKVIDWIRSQHRFYGLLSLVLEWES